MSELYHRVLLWHKLVAMVTGGLALCSAKHKLNREEAGSWIARLRGVADEMESVLSGGPFLLDDKGQRVVGSAVLRGTGLSREPRSNELAATSGPQGSSSPEEVKEIDHGVASRTSKPAGTNNGTVSPKKVGGLRVATRKKQ